jgi:hypothetical protein
VEELSVLSAHFFISSVSWNLRPFKADFIFGQPEVIRRQMRGIGWVFHFSNRFLRQIAPCELEHCHVGISNRWAKVKAFFYAQLYVAASIFPCNKLR